ncbi:hypothetical protein OV079_42520 [Nannocystis pusilla]|uniref:Uncharacterized protein n=1 Tax=Nannocystis pusilla TaxID=889268 RepID=A0A9X3EZB1_9BACT|nr:hypothetical protein [Nannocystis pusilla]MCY1012114.1 hypothetical protein [Nannocystis pusilla]
MLLQGLDPDSTLGELLGGTSGHVSRDSSFAARRDSFELPEERDEFDELDGDIPADLRQAVTAATSSQPQPSAPVIDDDPDSGLGGFARFQSMLKLSRPYPVRQPEPVVEEPRPTLMRSFALAAQRESDYPSSTPSPPADLSATLPLAAALGISSEESAALVLGIPDEDGSEGSGLNDFFNPNANPDLLGSRLSTTVSSRTSSHASGFIDDDDDVRMPIQDDDDDVRMPIQDDDDDLPLPTLQDDDPPGEAAPMLDDVSPFGSGLPAARLDDHSPVRRTSLDDVRSVMVDDDESPLRRAADDVRRGEDRPLRGPSIEDVRRLIAPTRRPSLDDVRSALMDDDEAPPSRSSVPVRRSSMDDVRSALMDDDEAPPSRSSAPVRRSSVDDVRSVLVDDDEAPPVRGSAPVRRPSVDDVRSALVDDDEAPPTRSSAPVRRGSMDDVRSALVDDDEAPPTRASAPSRHESLDDVRGVLDDDDDALSSTDDDDQTSAEPVRTRDTPPMPGLPAIDVDGDSGAPVLRHRTPKKKVVELGAPLAKPRAGSGTGAVGPRGPSPSRRRRASRRRRPASRRRRRPRSTTTSRS